MKPYKIKNILNDNIQTIKNAILKRIVFSGYEDYVYVDSKNPDKSDIKILYNTTNESISIVEWDCTKLENSCIQIHQFTIILNVYESMSDLSIQILNNLLNYK